MQIIGNKELTAQSKFGLFQFEELTPESIKGNLRVQAEIGPRQNIAVVASGQTDVRLSGGKCQHGVYIPNYGFQEDRAEYCSICNPYIVEVLGGSK